MFRIKEIIWYDSKIEKGVLYTSIIGFILFILFFYKIGLIEEGEINKILFWSVGIIIWIFMISLHYFLYKKFGYLKVGISDRFLHINRYKDNKKYEWNNIEKMEHLKPWHLVIYMNNNEKEGFVFNIKDINNIKNEFKQRNIKLITKVW